MMDADRTRPQSPDLRLISKQLCYLNVSIHSKLTTFLAISYDTILSRKLLQFEDSIIQLKFMFLKVSFQILVSAQVVLIFGREYEDCTQSF